MTTIAAIEFTQRARDLATQLDIAYWKAKQLSREWYGRAELAEDIPFNTDPVVDGNEGKPLTNMDVYGILNRADELIQDFEANNFAKYNTIVKASELPAE